MTNALVESVIGLYKTEVIRRIGPWRNTGHVEFETLDWVDWFNSRRLLEAIGYVPPDEFERIYYQNQEPMAMRQDSTHVPFGKPGAVQFAMVDWDEVL